MFPFYTKRDGNKEFGDGSVDKVIVMRAWGSELLSPELTLMQDRHGSLQAQYWERRPRRFQGKLAIWSSWNWQAPGPGRDPASINVVERSKERHLRSTSDFLIHVHTQMHAYTQMCVSKSIPHAHIYLKR